MSPLHQTLGLVASLLIASSAADPLRVARAVCNADNCARLVAGTSIVVKPSLSVRMSDCSSFLGATVTPAGTYSGSTVITVSSGSPTPTPATLPPATTNSGGQVPSYASSACGVSGPVLTSRYSSACVSCAGIKGSTATASAPSVVQTIYVPPCTSGTYNDNNSGPYTVTCNTGYSGGLSGGEQNGVTRAQCIDFCRAFEAQDYFADSCLYDAAASYCFAASYGSFVYSDVYESLGPTH